MCALRHVKNFKEELFLKRLFILLFSIIFAVGLVACGETEDTGSGDTADEATEEQTNEEQSDEGGAAEEEEAAEEPEAEESEDEMYGVGDTVEVDGVEFTLVGVSTTDERNEFAETDPTHVVEIEYEIVNNTEEEISIGMDLDVYDGSGSQAESYPLDSTLGSLKPGKNIQGVDYYGIEEGPIEIYFAPLISFEDPAVFSADIE